MRRLIDADILFDAMEETEWYNNADRDEIAERLIMDAPTIKTKYIKYFDEDENVWKVRSKQMIPIPIPIHYNTADEIAYIYPRWVDIIGLIGVGFIFLGVVWMAVALILSIITDDMIDATAVAIILLGFSMLFLAVILILIIGRVE